MALNTMPMQDYMGSSFGSYPMGGFGYGMDGDFFGDSIWGGSYYKMMYDMDAEREALFNAKTARNETTDKLIEKMYSDLKLGGMEAKVLETYDKLLIELKQQDKYNLLTPEKLQKRAYGMINETLKEKTGNENFDFTKEVKKYARGNFGSGIGFARDRFLDSTGGNEILQRVCSCDDWNTKWSGIERAAGKTLKIGGMGLAGSAAVSGTLGVIGAAAASGGAAAVSEGAAAGIAAATEAGAAAAAKTMPFWGKAAGFFSKCGTALKTLFPGKIFTSASIKAGGMKICSWLAAPFKGGIIKGICALAAAHPVAAGTIAIAAVLGLASFF